VRLVDGLELVLGVGLLAHVRVVLARELAVGRLDLGLARARLHAEDVVVVLELHPRSLPGLRPTPRRRPSCRRRGAGTVVIAGWRARRSSGPSGCPRGGRPGSGAAPLPGASGSRSPARR